MPRESAFMVLTVVVLLCQAARAAGPAATGPEGIWVGRCQLDGRDAFVLLRLQRDAGRATGLAYSPPLGMRTPVSDVEADGSRLALSFQTPEGTVRLSCDIRGDQLEG